MPVSVLDKAGACHIAQRGGYRYRVWEPHMPRIAESYLDCTFYVYKSVAEAKDGTAFGGTGFFVGMPSRHKGRLHLYAITNRHLIDRGFGVLRVNTLRGGTEPLKTRYEDWRSHPGGDDVSIVALADLDAQFKWHFIDQREFITETLVANLNIGPGDDAFLVGRLVNAAGRQRNTPIVRFGNVSMAADKSEPIIHPTYGPQTSFLVECRSLSGFSGSPVFVTSSQSLWIDQIMQMILQKRGKNWSPGDKGFPRVDIPGKYIGPAIVRLCGPWFLGIDWGHVPLWGRVYESDRKTQTPDGRGVEANTGIACVIPAWRILELLNSEEYMQQRQRDDDELDKRDESAVIPDSSPDPQTDFSETFTRDDILDALKQVSQKLSDQDKSET